MKYTSMDRLDWIQQTCTEEFARETLMHEMIRWMGENEFREFYDHLIRNWDIKRDPNDPDFDSERDTLE